MSKKDIDNTLVNEWTPRPVPLEEYRGLGKLVRQTRRWCSPCTDVAIRWTSLEYRPHPPVSDRHGVPFGVFACRRRR